MKTDNRGFDSDKQNPVHDQPVRRKEEYLISVYEKPLLPRLSRIIYIFFILILLAMTAVEISNYSRYGRHLGLRHLMQNLSSTGLAMSTIAGLILAAVSVPGMILNKRAVDRRNSGSEKDTDPAVLKRKRRAVFRLNRAYLVYLGTALSLVILFFFMSLAA